ncbi:MAG: hypothetical protein ACFB15_02385 [Cyclobacteriaceae bacterium]
MPQPAPAKETMYYGGSSHRPPEVTELRAGPLSCQYEEGNLRYIRAGEVELLRMIYSAVRDQNWNTVAPTLTQEKIEHLNDGFAITYNCRYREGDIDFSATYRITGEADGSIRFAMEGEALSTFQRNRIGFCVLHPASVAGADCQIESSEEEKTEGKFPVYISPHQPFKNIRRMRWSPTEEVTASIEFSGDIFETEDQRNWTDDSFKTYCTPLEKPFPVTVPQGERIYQEVFLKLEQAPSNISVNESTPQITITEKPTTKLPAIGIGRSAEVDTLSQENISLLKEIQFDYYRIDIKLFESDWQQIWRQAVREANILGCLLEVALHFSNDVSEELTAFINVVSGVKVKSVLILHQEHKVTPEALLNETIPILRRNFPDARLGSGTDHFFTELNRERIPSNQLDFLSYSINPQVHQFDNQSLIETLQAQAYTIASAQEFANGVPVQVSPVTLKMRRNPNATGPEPTLDPDTLPPTVDTRQASLFGAGWTVGSLRNLIQSGVSSVSYYETVGRKGIVAGEVEPFFSELGQLPPGTPYPMYLVFHYLLSEQVQEVFEVQSSHPWKVEGIVVRTDQGTKGIMANLQPEPVSIEILGDLFSSVKLLDEKNFASALEAPTSFLESDFSEFSTPLDLPPYALVFLSSSS